MRNSLDESVDAPVTQPDEVAAAEFLAAADPIDSERAAAAQAAAQGAVELAELAALTSAAAAGPVPSSSSQPGAGPPAPFTLAIDIGGSGIKCLILDGSGAPSGKRLRQETPRPATPQAVLTVIKELLPDLPFDRISIGFPGVVVDGVTQSAPNLHRSWRGYPLAQAVTELTGRPTRVVNDAGMQGLGVIAGKGVEIVVTLGTGMGFALFVGGTYAPNIELAHHPLRKGRTYEESIGNQARLSAGNKKWTRRVVRALKQIQATFNPGILYVGGGNATKLAGVELPAGVKIVENVAGLLGGIALWHTPRA